MTERVRVSGACLLGGLSRLIRICGMGRGRLVDVAITSGVNDRPCLAGQTLTTTVRSGGKAPMC